MSSGKWRPFCLGLYVLKTGDINTTKQSITKISAYFMRYTMYDVNVWKSNHVTDKRCFGFSYIALYIYFTGYTYYGLLYAHKGNA